MEKFRMKHLSFSSISSFISRLTRANLWKNFLYQLHWRTKKLTVPITVKTMIAIFPQKASPVKKLKITKWLISTLQVFISMSILLKWPSQTLSFVSSVLNLRILAIFVFFRVFQILLQIFIRMKILISGLLNEEKNDRTHHAHQCYRKHYQSRTKFFYIMLKYFI